ncbi:MAG: sodium:proton antiporter [Solirubrobacterales bacterium]|nr:sodium:proton antiporter [Solirubrobacterales bacterium]
MAIEGIDAFVLLLIAATIVTVAARWVGLSYTLSLLLLGLAIGASPVGLLPALSSEIILLLFLPPLLFEAAFVLDLRLLWDVRVGVLALAVPGVLVAMVVGGALVHWSLGLPWAVALLFGAMIAATDPVAVLATFRQLGIDQRLSILIEGESLLNDGIALVLLVTLVAAVDGEFQLSSAIGTVLLSVIGGTVIGLGCGWVGHRLIASVDEHLTEMTVSVATAYGAFLVADTLHLSGVLATIVAAMTLGYLGRKRGWVYSEGSEQVLIDLWAFLAFIANAPLFLLMGLTVRTADVQEHPQAVLVGIATALTGRAVVAYGIGSLLNQVGVPLKWAERHVLFWGGLRGGVALAAALSLPQGFPHRGQLLAMTYGAVLFTLLAQGLTISPLVQRLGLLNSADTPEIVQH